MNLPPAGSPISLARNGELPEFPGYISRWVNTGTAALALALVAARQQRPHVEQPEVILPGYGCPDLVAAAEFAGLNVVLADIGADDSGYDITALERALTKNSVAVVAVNFLGIRDRLSDVRQLIGPSVALIEDNAQWFPEPTSNLQGDFVCLSFGRGKPVSLLGGGALLIKQSLAKLVEPLLPVGAPVNPGSSYLPKIAAYNCLLNPLPYGLLSRNPWLKLGQTRYKPLHAIRAMDNRRLSLLAANVNLYLGRERSTEARLCEIIAENPHLIDIAANAGARSGRLLRYPLLCRDIQQRDRLREKLLAEGLGATIMYQKVLPEIPNTANRIFSYGELVGAKSFAQRLVTIPLHVGVNAKHLKRIGHIVNHA